MGEFWIRVQRLRESAFIPQRATDHAAGYDLFTDRACVVYPGCQVEIPLGIATAFPPAWAAMILDRSSLGRAGIARHAGLIDADYRGEWIVLLRNHGEQKLQFAPGEKVAQVVFVPVATAEPWVVEELPSSFRGDGGFGSTGR